MAIFNQLSRILPWARGEQRSNPLENPAISINAGINTILSLGLGAEPTAAGEIINEHLAEQFWAVYTAVRIIAEQTSGLPLLTYKRINKGRNEAIDDPIHRMLSVEPNPFMTAVTFWETIVHNMALTGNGYALMGRNPLGEPVELYPLHPFAVRPVRLPTGAIGYEVKREWVPGTEGTRLFNGADILHFPLMSWGGLQGDSPIHHCRSTIGLAKAIEKYASKFFGNGSLPSGGILQVKDGVQVQEKDMVNMRTFWEQANGGENRSRITILPKQWTYEPGAQNINNENSQLLQARARIIAEIAAMFRLPSHMLGDTTRLSNNNVEQQNLGFLRDTLKPYTTKIEQECNRKLFDDAPDMFVQFNYAELLRGDSETSMKVFATGRQWGILTANECREAMGYNPIGAEGDITWSPVNMQNAGWMLETENMQDVAPTLPIPKDPTLQDETGQDEADESNSHSHGMAHYTTAYRHLFRDAVGRALNRQQLDSTTLRTLFLPVINTLTETVNARVGAQFGADDKWEPSDSANDIVKGLEKRSSKWTKESADAIADDELARTVRAVFINSSKDAAAFAAIKQLNNSR